MTPMELQQQPAAFSSDEWLFEIKYDGFRSLAYIEEGECKLVSRNDYTYGRFKDLAEALPEEIACVDAFVPMARR